jgi:hypothetical protein
MSNGADSLKNAIIMKPGLGLVEKTVFVKYIVTPEFEVQVALDDDVREIQSMTTDVTRPIIPPKPEKLSKKELTVQTEGTQESEKPEIPVREPKANNTPGEEPQ